MTSPHFRMLSKDEYNALRLEQRVAYMRELMDHIRHQLRDTRQQIESRKTRVDKKE